MADSLPEVWGGFGPCEPRRLHSEVNWQVPSWSKSTQVFHIPVSVVDKSPRLGFRASECLILPCTIARCSSGKALERDNLRQDV